MKNKDRNEILAQLQDAFGTDEKRESRLITETVRIDTHNVARVTEIKDPSKEEQLYARYPEAITIKEMISILEGNHESNIKNAGIRLRKMLTNAFDDEVMIEKLVALCRDFELRFTVHRMI